MICDRAERRVGGTSAPVFGGGFLGFPRKVGYLIGGIFISLPQKWLNDRGQQTAAAPLGFLPG